MKSHMRFYLFFLLISIVKPSISQAISIHNNSDCVVAIFSFNGSTLLVECTIPPSETCQINNGQENKLVAVDAYALGNPRFKTELILDQVGNAEVVINENARCQEQHTCDEICPLSYSEQFSNVLDGIAQSDTYQAFLSIDSKHIINTNSSVSYSAGDHIYLKHPFDLSIGSEFYIEINQCDDLVIDNEKTNQLVLLGNVPRDLGFQQKERNIWDLQLFENRIFLGFGNTTTNPGPIPLVSWDNELDSFIAYGSIKSEAIEKFRIITDSLFIPNSDPRGGDTRKYNVVKNGQVSEIVLDYKMAHVRDIIPFNNKYYLLGNTRCPGEFSSECSGLLQLTGSVYQTDMLTSEFAFADPYINARWNWFFGGWTYQDQLIIPNAMFNEIYSPNLVIQDAQFFTITNNEITWSAHANEFEQLKHHHFFPADTMTTSLEDTIKFHTILRPQTSVEVSGKLVYTLRSYSVNQNYNNLYIKQYNNSRGMYLKEALYDQAKEVVFPEPDAVGEDLLLIGSKLYALAHKKLISGDYKNYVYSSDAPTINPECWKEEFNFKSTNLARSFEYFNNDFYFGLGMNEGDDIESAGDLYKLNWVIPHTK